MNSNAEPTYGADFYAKLFRLTTRRIQQLAKDGIIPKSGRGKYPLLGVISGYVAYLQERALSGEVGPAEYQNEKALKTKFEREKLEIEVQVLKGELVPKAQVDQAIGELISACKSRLLSIPTKAAAVAVSMTEAEVAGLLTDQIYEALHELSRTQRITGTATETDSEQLGGSTPSSVAGGQRRTGYVEH